MIGRKREQDRLDGWAQSPRPEFVVVYGRRRVGKTYLVEQHFKGRFAFRATGVATGNMRIQLRAFHEKLVEYGSPGAGRPATDAPADWFGAFAQLRALLEREDAQRDPVTGKLVVFIDEMPWMDTPRSNFKAALEHFWNDWGATRDDLLLIACGSATSWLTKNLLKNTEGFYGRVTGKVNLQPFTLGECEELLRYNGLEATRQQVIEYYLVFGGIPYYLNLLHRSLSPAQNIDALCFAKGGQLEGEFGLLFRSLFKHPDGYMAVVRALAKRADGMTNSELREQRGLPTGASLTRVLENLELCGFIRADPDPAKEKYGKRFVVSDPFTAFHLRYLEIRRFDSWAAHANSAAYYSWRGLSFERIVPAFVPQIKEALGIRGVETRSYPWAGEGPAGRAQIDLVIDRADGIVDLCEVKFTDAPFAMGTRDHEQMVRAREAFVAATGTRKAVHLALISAAGVAAGKYANDVQAVITADELFG